MSLKRLLTARSLTGLLVLTVSFSLIFQNCGSNDNSGAAVSFLASLADDEKFKAAPFPYDFNYNQVAYMTCPAVKKGPETTEDLDSPFFSIRGGSFDNRQLATRFPQIFQTANLADPELTYRLKAGVGLNRAFLDYIKTTFSSRLEANPSAESFKKLLREALIGSTGSNLAPFSALVYRQRSSQGGFTWDFLDGKGALSSFSDENTANQLINGMDMGKYGTERINYVQGAELNERSLIISLRASENEQQRDFVTGQLGTNLQLVAGFADRGSNNPAELEPKNENQRRLYGRSYRLGTSRNWPGRIDYAPDANGNQQAFAARSITSDFVSEIQEVDISTANEKDLTANEKQKWDCFALMIVRDIDRRDSLTGQPYDPDYDPNLWDGQMKLKYYNLHRAPTEPVIPGVRAACPPQEVGTATQPGSLNFAADGNLTMLRLEIARRFLPADFWELNTNPEYMCAVPRKTVQGFGQCYSSGNGDFDGSQYIMYIQSGQENGQNVTCGYTAPNGTVQKECPAYVSVCYRLQ